ncbi:hypothetical protein BHM03_00051992 [Ensete ventricosum]|uniref:Uncharacterized protein n=1 Tax=Ensete ventricosum TaxID=4639 RepID=A0A445MLP7_ENSVE|nr:hypothetical protein BHM03_00051992 [Ensete ventricosum]
MGLNFTSISSLSPSMNVLTITFQTNHKFDLRDVQTWLVFLHGIDLTNLCKLVVRVLILRQSKMDQQSTFELPLREYTVYSDTRYAIVYDVVVKLSLTFASDFSYLCLFTFVCRYDLRHSLFLDKMDLF